jgi:formylglycine-generating enzyme required for sulfatase activity
MKQGIFSIKLFVFLFLSSLLIGCELSKPLTTDSPINKQTSGANSEATITDLKSVSPSPVIYELTATPEIELPTITVTPLPTVTPKFEIGSTQVSPIDNMVMVYVPSGKFLMGSLEEVENGDEDPVHSVYLDAFWIGQTEVTNGIYAKCVNQAICSPPSDYSSYSRNNYYNNSQYLDFPVVFMTWDQARTFCEWANKRLPTEAEWEKAARGIQGQKYPWGNTEPTTVLANYNGNMNDTDKVGQYPEGASPYGVLDMSGNVWEWVADWYGQEYYSSSPDDNPQGPTKGDYRVLRGGSWFFDAFSMRSAIRIGWKPNDPRVNIGFRCALSTDP